MAGLGDKMLDGILCSRQVSEVFGENSGQQQVPLQICREPIELPPNLGYSFQIMPLLLPGHGDGIRRAWLRRGVAAVKDAGQRTAQERPEVRRPQVREHNSAEGDKERRQRT